MDPLAWVQQPSLFTSEACTRPLVVLGSANADVFVEVSRLPKPGETLAASSGQVLPGGKGANQAACAAKLGFQDTYFCGQVGNDAHASLILDALSSAGVLTDHVGVVKGEVTGSALVLLQPGGVNSIIIVAGANGTWGRGTTIAPAASTPHPNTAVPEDLLLLPPNSAALIRQAGALLLQREVPDEVNVCAAKIAHAAGVPVLLDAGGMDSLLPPSLLSLLDLLSPNETELDRMTGGQFDTGSREGVEAAARELQRQTNVPEILVKLGSQGSLLLTRAGKVVHQEAVKAEEVVDTTGAGDTFTAAFAVARMRGLGDEAALHFASCAASLCVARKGAIPAMPSLQQVVNLLALTRPHSAWGQLLTL